MAFKISLMNVHSELNFENKGESSTQSLNWLSATTALVIKPIDALPKLELGLSYQQLPVFYQNTNNQAGKFGNASVLSATFGFNTKKIFEKKGFMYWDQRLIVPISATTNGEVTSFAAKIGTEGVVGYFHCLNDDWAVGTALTGQITQTEFHVPQDGNLQADAPHSTMFNTNVQLRLRKGVCP